MVSKATTNERSMQFGELVNKLGGWQIPEDALPTVHDAARASLNEVKALTEYEDGKVSRLLTVIAFLSAVVAAVFTRFATKYPWPQLGSYCASLSWWLPFVTYMVFFVYLLLVTSATLILIGAIKPTFNRPASWKGDAKSGIPGSMLFYEKILDVTAPTWGEAFITQSKTKGTELKAYYAKCYIAEAYLVAQKVADKLRIVAPGVGALRWSMAVLILFFVLLAVTTQIVPPPDLN